MILSFCPLQSSSRSSRESLQALDLLFQPPYCPTYRRPFTAANTACILASTNTALNIVWKIIHSFRERVVHRYRSPKKRTTTYNLAGFDVDGPADAALGSMNTRRRRQGGDVCAVFVHAGAGYHSIQNERIHLQACEQYVYRSYPWAQITAWHQSCVEIHI